MKFIKRLTTLVPMLGLALVAYGQSGGTGTQGGTGQTGQPGQTGRPTQTGQKPGDTATSTMSHKGDMHGKRLHSINDVIGMKVTNPQGEEIGKLEDVVVHPRGEIAYAVLSMTGQNDKFYAIPWTVLQMHGAATGAGAAGETRAIVLPVAKERLGTAPSFSKSTWPNMTTPDWSRDIDQFFAAERRSTTGRPVEAGARMAGQPVWRASELRGTNVESTTGEKLGDVREIVVDTRGHVSFVVVSVGGFLGMGDRQVPVPFEALKPKMEAGATADKAAKIDTFTLATTKERLKEAPEFKSGRENWAQMTDPAFVSKVYEYYSVRPYWSDMDDMDSGTGATGGTRGGTGSTGTGGGSRTDKGTGGGTDDPK